MFEHRINNSINMKISYNEIVDIIRHKFGITKPQVIAKEFNDGFLTIIYTELEKNRKNERK